MPNGTYGGVRGRKTKVGRKLLRFPPTRLDTLTCSLSDAYLDKSIKIITTIVVSMSIDIV